MHIQAPKHWNSTVIQQSSSYFIPIQVNHILLTIQDLLRPNYYVSDPLNIALYSLQYTGAISQTIILQHFVSSLLHPT